MENFGYLFAAYTIIFAVIFLYVMFIWRRQVRLESEVRAIEQRLKELQLSAEPDSGDSAKAQS